MSATTVIESAALEGVELRVVDGEIKVCGDRTTVERWLPKLRERKAELLAALHERERVVEAWVEAMAEAPDDEWLINCQWLPLGRNPELAAEVWRALSPELRERIERLAGGTA